MKGIHLLAVLCCTAFFQSASAQSVTSGSRELLPGIALGASDPRLEQDVANSKKLGDADFRKLRQEALKPRSAFQTRFRYFLAVRFLNTSYYRSPQYPEGQELRRLLTRDKSIPLNAAFHIMNWQIDEGAFYMGPSSEKQAKQVWEAMKPDLRAAKIYGNILLRNGQEEGYVKAVQFGEEVKKLKPEESFGYIIVAAAYMSKYHDEAKKLEFLDTGLQNARLALQFAKTDVARTQAEDFIGILTRLKERHGKP